MESSAPKRVTQRYYEAFPPAEEMGGMLKQASLTGQTKALHALLEKALARGSKATDSEVESFMRLPRTADSPLRIGGPLDAFARLFGD